MPRTLDAGTGLPGADAVYHGRITRGIYLQDSPATIAAGAYVTNSKGPDAVYGAVGTAWNLVNYGIVNGGASGTGVFLGGGGIVTNDGSGTIAGGVAAITIDGGPGYVTNSGDLAGGSAGVYLAGGGTVANQQSATIDGGTLGVVIAAGNATVTNAGTISGTGSGGSGIYLRAGGYASIAATGYVSGASEAIVVNGGAGTIVNLGVLTSSSGDGVYLQAGGTVDNGSSGQPGATIYGAVIGIDVQGGEGAVVNYGAIAGATNNGVYLQAGGSVTNEPGGAITAAGEGVRIAGGDATVVNYGTISGFFGVYIDPGANGQATIINAGTIIGTTGQAVRLAEGNDLLIVEPGAVFIGGIAGAGTSSIELTAGGQTGTLLGFHTEITGFASVTIDPGAVWQLDGDAHVITFTNDGTIIVAGGDAMVFGAVGEDGGDKGLIDIGKGATATFDGAVAAGQRIDFAGKDATMVLGDAGDFAARIVAFKRGDTIDLVDAKANHLSFAHGVLTLTEHGKTVATLDFAGNFKTSDFMLGSDGHGGTDITLKGGGAIAGASGAAADPWSYSGAATVPFWLLPS